MDFISIPEKIGSELPLLSGMAEAQISRMTLGKSQSGNPKITVEFVCMTEFKDEASGDTTIGAKILDTLSLQPNALFRLENYMKAANGDGLPKGKNISTEELMMLVSETLIGTRWNLDLKTEPNNKGENRTVIGKIAYLGK